MKKYFMLVVLSLLLSACTTVQPQMIADRPSEGQLVDIQSELDRQLPAILLQHENKLALQNTPIEIQPITAIAQKEPEEIKPERMEPERIAYTERDVQCLARNLFHEAWMEGDRGMLAVGYVTVNRTRSGKYPKTICAVVHQPYQFSWTRKKSSISNEYARARTRELAVAILEGEAPNPVGSAISFHNGTVRPAWRGRMKFVSRIGNHFFYR